MTKQEYENLVLNQVISFNNIIPIKKEFYQFLINWNDEIKRNEFFNETSDKYDKILPYIVEILNIKLSEYGLIIKDFNLFFNRLKFLEQYYRPRIR